MQSSDTPDMPQLTDSDQPRQQVVSDFESLLGAAVLDSYVDPGVDVWLRVDTKLWSDFADAAQRLGFEFFDWLSIIDWMESPYGRSLDTAVDREANGDVYHRSSIGEITTGLCGGDTRFQLIARVYSLSRRLGVTVKADVSDELVAPSWVDHYPGARWHEREAFEMFGINFVGHRDLRNIYLPSGFEGNPLRKDYPLMARLVKPWPGVVDVEPMIDDETKSTQGGASTKNPDAHGPGEDGR